MLLFTYITLLLLIILSILLGLKLCTRVPNKIKLLSSIALTLLLLRYLSLIILFLENNIKYMYMVKSIYFLYFACIPILGFISLYILWRNDKIYFRYVAIISSLYIIIYFMCMFKIETKVTLFYNYNFGYIINLASGFWYIDIIYLFINVAILIIAVSIFNKNRSDKIGSALVIFAALSTIVIIMLTYLLNNFIPQYCFNELLWVIALDYCLAKTGRKNKGKS